MQIYAIYVIHKYGMIVFVFNSFCKFYLLLRSLFVSNVWRVPDNKIKTTANSSSYDGGAYMEIEPYSVEMELTEAENQKYLKVGTDSMKCTEVTNETAEE